MCWRRSRRSSIDSGTTLDSSKRDFNGWGHDHFNVDHGLYGHESILKFISYRFGLGDLNTRMKFANNIGRSFEWHRPDF